MKLIARINSRSNPEKPYWEKTFEAEKYEDAYQMVQESLTADDQLLSVLRIEPPSVL